MPSGNYSTVFDGPNRRWGEAPFDALSEEHPGMDMHDVTVTHTSQGHHVPVLSWLHDRGTVATWYGLDMNGRDEFTRDNILGNV